MIMQSMLSYQGSQAKSWFNSLSADENSHHKTDHRLDLSPTTARGGDLNILAKWIAISVRSGMDIPWQSCASSRGVNMYLSHNLHTSKANKLLRLPSKMV
jgi:hypothetical protein